MAAKRNDELTKKAIAWLKKKAIEKAKKGTKSGYNTAYNVGQILNGLGYRHDYSHRNKEYMPLVEGLKHAKELGIVASYDGHGRGAYQFNYIGLEVQGIYDDAVKAKEDNVKYANKLIRKIRLKSARIGEKSWTRDEVTMDINDFIRLAERVK